VNVILERFKRADPKDLWRVRTQIGILPLLLRILKRSEKYICTH